MTKLKKPTLALEPSLYPTMTEDEFRAFIGSRSWVFAKTMPQWPHEYTVRRDSDPDVDQQSFWRAVMHIRRIGERRKFKASGSKFTYFDIDGRQYWTMGAPLPITIILNRAWVNWEERLASGEDPASVAKNDPSPQFLENLAKKHRDLQDADLAASDVQSALNLEQVRKGAA